MLVVNTALEISTLSSQDDVYLTSTLHALSNQDFICSMCKVKYINRADGDRIGAKWRRIKGCESINTGPMPLHYIDKDSFRINYSTCIGNFFSPAVVAWVQAYRKFDKGIMPYAGGYMDQPNKALEILRVIDTDFQTRAQAERSKKRGSESARLRKIKNG